MRGARAFALILFFENADRERVRNTVQRFYGGNGDFGGIDLPAVFVFEAQ